MSVRCAPPSNSSSSVPELKSSTLLTNSPEVLPILRNFTIKALEKFDSGAYLHKYYEVGMEKDDFEEAFRTVEKIIYDYETM